jgi:hypothetical protein
MKWWCSFAFLHHVLLNVCTFQRNVQPPSSRWLNCFKLIMKWYRGRNVGWYGNCDWLNSHKLSYITKHFFLHVTSASTWKNSVTENDGCTLRQKVRTLNHYMVHKPTKRLPFYQPA